MTEKKLGQMIKCVQICQVSLPPTAQNNAVDNRK